MNNYKRLTIRLSNGKIGCLQEYSQKDLINRLAELEDKIEDGTLIMTPCKVGDKVYMPGVYDGASAVAELTVKHIDLEEKIIATILESDVFGYLRKYDYGVFGFEDMGAVIFLTKAEAEAKLKKENRV